jgi:hypothetical protein
MIQETFSIDSVFTHCAENIQRTLISVTKRTFTRRCKYRTLVTWAILGALHICNAGTLRVNFSVTCTMSQDSLTLYIFLKAIQ